MHHVGQALAQPWWQTPSFLQDRARRIHSALLALNDVITELVRAHQLATDAPKYKAWKRLLDNWGTWYHDSTAGTWMWTGTDATLETYEIAIKDWRTWLAQNYPTSVQALPAAPPTFGPGGAPRDDVPAWAILGIALVGGFLAFKVLKS